MNSHPDHDTIATFRKRLLKELSRLFVQTPMIARQANMLDFGSVSLDGSEVEVDCLQAQGLELQAGLQAGIVKV